MFALYQKEIRSFLDSAIAYVAIGVFLTAMGLFTWVFPESSVLNYGFADMDAVFSAGPFAFLILVPAITMRSIAEERKTGTLELLITRPLSLSSIVGGKFLAAWSLVGLSLLPTVVYYISIYQLGMPKGNIDTASVIGSYLGLLLLGGVYCSVGLLASAWADSQVTAFIVSAFGCFFLFSGLDSLSQLNVWGPVAPILAKMSLITHYTALSKGLIDSRNVLYLLSIGLLALYGTRVALERRA
jgi:ABC-2 type transport system permease protein